MTDMEIYNWLYNLEPENIEQENKIKAMMRIMSLSTQSHIKEFLDTLNFEEIIDRPTKEVYTKYSNWADKNNYEKVGHNIFSQAVQNKFYVKSKTVKSKGKCIKAYKIVL